MTIEGSHRRCRLLSPVHPLPCGCSVLPLSFPTAVNSLEVITKNNSSKGRQRILLALCIRTWRLLLFRAWRLSILRPQRLSIIRAWRQSKQWRLPPRILPFLSNNVLPSSRTSYALLLWHGMRYGVQLTQRVYTCTVLSTEREGASQFRPCITRRSKIYDSTKHKKWGEAS